MSPPCHLQCWLSRDVALHPSWRHLHTHIHTQGMWRPPLLTLPVHGGKVHELSLASLPVTENSMEE